MAAFWIPDSGLYGESARGVDEGVAVVGEVSAFGAWSLSGRGDERWVFPVLARLAASNFEARLELPRLSVGGVGDDGTGLGEMGLGFKVATDSGPGIRTGASFVGMLYYPVGDDAFQVDDELVGRGSLNVEFDLLLLWIRLSANIGWARQGHFWGAGTVVGVKTPPIYLFVEAFFDRAEGQELVFDERRTTEANTFSVGPAVWAPLGEGAFLTFRVGLSIPLGFEEGSSEVPRIRPGQVRDFFTGQTRLYASVGVALGST